MNTDTRNGARPLAEREWFSPDQAAEYLGLTSRAMEDMRYRKTGPGYSRVNTRTIRYRRADLDAWLEAGRVRA